METMITIDETPTARARAALLIDAPEGVTRATVSPGYDAGEFLNLYRDDEWVVSGEWNYVGERDGVEVYRRANETADHFVARVEARTGVALAAIPDGAPDLMLAGQILCRRGRTAVVTVGYPTETDDGEVYTAFAVVDRESDLPAYAG